MLWPADFYTGRICEFWACVGPVEVFTRAALDRTRAAQHEVGVAEWGSGGRHERLLTGHARAA
eukprot:7588849-Alexandrium_andersonii.AAC.1